MKMNIDIQHLFNQLRPKLLPMAEILSKHGVTPTALTWTGLAMAFASSILIWQGWLFTGGLVAALSGLCDALDGTMARQKGPCSVKGIVLDSSVDRYADFFLLAGLVFLYMKRHFMLNVLLALLAIIGSFMVSYAQAKGEALQVETPTGLMKRPVRWSLLVFSLLLAGLTRNHIPIFLCLLVLGVGSNVSAIRRLNAIAQASSAKPPVA